MLRGLGFPTSTNSVARGTARSPVLGRNGNGATQTSSPACSSSTGHRTATGRQWPAATPRSAWLTISAPAAASAVLQLVPESMSLPGSREARSWEPHGGPVSQPALGRTPRRPGTSTCKYRFMPADGSDGFQCELREQLRRASRTQCQRAALTYHPGHARSPHLQIPPSRCRTRSRIRFRSRVECSELPNPNCRGPRLQQQLSAGSAPETACVPRTSGRRRCADLSPHLCSEPSRAASTDRAAQVVASGRRHRRARPCDGLPVRGFGGRETVRRRAFRRVETVSTSRWACRVAIAKDQDEPPIAFNLGDRAARGHLLDCDPGSPRART